MSELRKRLMTLSIAGRGKSWSTRRRQEIWCGLPFSARVVLLFWTARQPDGWWSLLDHVEACAGVDALCHRWAIRPLIDAGWVICGVATSHELWLTRDGRNARAALLLAWRGQG